MSKKVFEYLKELEQSADVELAQEVATRVVGDFDNEVDNLVQIIDGDRILPYTMTGREMPKEDDLMSQIGQLNEFSLLVLNNIADMVVGGNKSISPESLEKVYNYLNNVIMMTVETFLVVRS